MDSFLTTWLVWARAHAAQLVALAVFALSLWLFLELADDAPEGDYLEVENQILRALRSPTDPAEPIGPAWLTEATHDVTALGGVSVLVLVTALSVGFLLVRGSRRSALLLFLGVAGGYALNDTLKQLYERKRPEIVPHLVEESSMSFPSGHSMLGAVIYLTLGAMLAQSVTRKRERIYVIAVAIVLSGLIGLSRVYLGVHYPTDVLAGWSLGLCWALVCSGIEVWQQRRGMLAAPGERDP